MYVADVRPSSDGRANLLIPPTYFDDKEKIIYSVTWANPTVVSLTWENRHQNYSLVSVCDVARRIPNCKDSLVMTEPNGWLELDQAPVFTKDGKRFAMILPAEGKKLVANRQGCTKIYVEKNNPTNRLMNISMSHYSRI